MDQKLKDMSEALIKGQAPLVKELVQICLSNGVAPQEILSEGLIAGMNVIGKRFKKDEIFLPEVMIAARAMHAGLDILDPVLSESNIEPRGKIVLGTVRGDLHDVGKNLVSMMFRGAGFKVIDLGIDVPDENFVDAVQENRPDILGLSALLTTTMPEMQKVIEALEEAGLKDQVKVIVGGAPIDQAFADTIGADGFGKDAVEAVQLARDLMAAK